MDDRVMYCLGVHIRVMHCNLVSILLGMVYFFDSVDSSVVSESRVRAAVGGGTMGKNCSRACRCPGPRLRMTALPAPAMDIDRPRDSVAIDDSPIVVSIF